MNAQHQSDTSDREIVISRTFDAPRELVFRAYTEQRHIEKWWGPNGFTVTTHEMDVRPGGAWRYTFHGPDGTDWENWIAYREIERPVRLAYDHGGTKDDGSFSTAFEVTVTFEEADGKTTVTMRSVFPTVEARDTVVNVYGAIEGGKQTLARLAEHLKTM